MTRNQYDTLPPTAFQVIQYICSFSCSPPGQKPYPNGPQWFIGPVREVEADSRFGQRQEENKDYPIFPESHLERYPNVVSIPVRSFNCWRCEPTHADRQTDRHCAATAAKVKFNILFRVLHRPVSDKDLKY